MKTQTQSWQDLLVALRDTFERLLAQKTLLASIDRSILDGPTRGGGAASSIESLFHESLVNLSKVFRLEEVGLCYAYTGQGLVLLQEAVRLTKRPERIAAPAFLVKRVIPSTPKRIKKNRLSKRFYAEMGNPADVVACPICTPQGDVLCVFLFVDQDATPYSKLTQEFLEALRETATQLSVAHNTLCAAEQNDGLRNLWNLFLSTNLSPHMCFNTLAKQVQGFLPTFGPLTIPSCLQSQILVLQAPTSEHLPAYLTIRATTGDEPDTTRIDISKSICGLLIEQSANQLPYFCADPQKPRYKGRYRDYLGIKSGGQIKTECAVRLTDDQDRTVGILNLETPDQDAFDIHQIRTLLLLAKQITPLVTVFEDRLQQNKLVHRSLVATTATYLDSIASVFRHGIGTPIANLRTDIDLVRGFTGTDLPVYLRVLEDGRMKEESVALKTYRSIAAILEKSDRALSRLLSVTTQIGTFAHDFSLGISGFGNFGRLDLFTITEETINLVERSLLARTDAEITIQLRKEPGITTTDIFCSPLVKHHVFCLINNAILAIKERQTSEKKSGTNPTAGHIRMFITKVQPQHKGQEMALNEAFRLSIRDNGPGVTRDQLLQLRQFKVGTRYRQSAGMGQGLAAAQRFMASINGRIWLESEKGKFFDVELYFDAYRKELHEALTTTPT